MQEEAMDEELEPETGSIGWIDLTVANAAEIRDFYSAVVGWRSSAVDVGGYDDFNMGTPESDSPMAGVCHARGMNAKIPPVWMIYINVADLDESLERCTERGGKIVAQIRTMGDQGRYAMIQDPAGAVCALFEPA